MILLQIGDDFAFNNLSTIQARQILLHRDYLKEWIAEASTARQQNPKDLNLWGYVMISSQAAPRYEF